MTKDLHSGKFGSPKNAPLNYITKMRACDGLPTYKQLVALFGGQISLFVIRKWRSGERKMPPKALAIVEAEVNAIKERLDASLAELKARADSNPVEKAKRTVQARKARIAKELDDEKKARYWAGLLKPEN